MEAKAERDGVRYLLELAQKTDIWEIDISEKEKLKDRKIICEIKNKTTDNSHHKEKHSGLIFLIFFIGGKTTFFHKGLTNNSEQKFTIKPGIHSFFFSNSKFSSAKYWLKATPHNYCRAYAPSDFSSDCMNFTQAGCRLSRKICAIWRKICKHTPTKPTGR